MAWEYEIGDFVEVRVTQQLSQNETTRWVGAIITGKHKEGGWNLHMPGWDEKAQNHIYEVQEAALNVPETDFRIAQDIPNQLRVKSTGAKANRINGIYTRGDDKAYTEDIPESVLKSATENSATQRTRCATVNMRPAWYGWSPEEDIPVVIAIKKHHGKHSWSICRRAHLDADMSYALFPQDVWVPNDKEKYLRSECWGVYDSVWIADKSLEVTEIPKESEFQIDENYRILT